MLLAGPSNFYSHAPRGARPENRESAVISVDFYSHAPRGARQLIFLFADFVELFLLTRPSRGATREELRSNPAGRISTHTPLAGRDVSFTVPAYGSMGFLLTRPSRGATEEIIRNVQIMDFYSHAPRGARRIGGAQGFPVYDFYSHAPRGARRFLRYALKSISTFLLTRPSRGATGHFRENRRGHGDFYSHAPRGARP